MPLLIGAMVLLAALVSAIPTGISAATGGTADSAAGGLGAWLGGAGLPGEELDTARLTRIEGFGGIDTTGPTDGVGPTSAFPEAPAVAVEDPGESSDQGAFLETGELLKPVAVDTSVEDGRDRLRTYKVRAGDTLTGIARRFGVSMMTVWWANKLKSKDDLRVGQTLVIPPVNGIVIEVKEGDSLAAIAARTDTSVDEIVAFNGLQDTNLVIGQVLIVPGALGRAIPTPKATPRPKNTTAGQPRRDVSSGRTVVRPPPSYSGGRFAWPVPGGSISQYFHYGHYAIDISADYGSSVRAAASGTVIFAGWKSNGGGYQIWIAHGSNLYTTYNHLAGIAVGTGEHVGRGEHIGRVGQSGWATGPHLHFEVWRGPIWNGGYRVNPMGFY